MAAGAAAGGRFDFDDGGAYAGGWAEGRASGFGVCTGPKGVGWYAGAWAAGFETCGVYEWPCGGRYEGEWSSGRRHGLGRESRGRWTYRGEWTEGVKGRYGTRQSAATPAKYDGTWAAGLQDGYGSETYADGGTFQGQWLKGMRHGYGVRSSAPFGLAARTKRRDPRRNMSPEEFTDEFKGGFVLKDNRDSATLGRTLLQQPKRSVLKRLFSSSGGGSSSTNKTWRHSYEEEDGSDGAESDGSFTVDGDETVDVNVIETYMGEWKNDKRSGFGIAERSDGIKYEGEWYNNKKFGYGRTTYKNGNEESGKWQNNLLLSSDGRRFLRSAKLKERVGRAVDAAHRSSHIALQKADIAISRTATARGKAEQADAAAKRASADCDIAKMVAKQHAPEFQLPDSEHQKKTSREQKGQLPEFTFLPAEPRQHLEPPQPTAFLDLFRNNPEGRRPSTFLRRPSTAHLRRPSTVIELTLQPSLFGHSYQPHFPSGFPSTNEYSGQSELTIQQVVDDHFHHYYESQTSDLPRKPKPAIDLTELLALYGIVPMEDSEQNFFLPQRRSTLPTVLDPNLMSSEGVDPLAGSDGIVRSGSLYTRKAEVTKTSSSGSARKKSLPDITNVQESRVLTREAIAALSSQRREAIRRQEEEAERLRANPLLYLVSPAVWDWLASQQLVILILVINIALGFLFFKVIL